MVDTHNAGPTSCMPIIEFKDVTYTYSQNIQDANALDHVSFQIAQGEMIAIMGANGSGKSTLAKLADAIAAPSSGEVYIFGKRAETEADAFEIRKQIGFVFQDPDNQFVATTVEDEVAFGPENLGIEPSEILNRVKRSLNEVGLSAYQNRDVNTLSGGQKQRVAIACALAMNPKILILDEATSMLDAKAASDLIELVCSLHDSGMTIVMITHSPKLAERAQRLIVLQNGKVAFDGTPNKYGKDIGWPRLPSKAELEAVQPKSMNVGNEGGECGESADGICETATAPAHDSQADPKREILTYENVAFTYDDAKAPSYVFEDVSFNVTKDEIVAIMGQNGSGKSTLLKMANGLLKPSLGRVCLNGIDIASKEESNKARFKVGLCFQYPEKQLFASSVFEDVAFGPRNLRLSNDEIESRVRESLNAVQLNFDEIAHRSPFSLSGGQMRRVAIAGVLAMAPSVLVMDEPCAGLDMDAHADLMYMLAKLRRSGMTILMATHDAEEAQALADRIIYLDKP